MVSCEGKVSDGESTSQTDNYFPKGMTNPDSSAAFKSIEAQITQAANLRYTFPDSSLGILDETYKQSVTLDYSHGIASSLTVKSLTYYEKGDYTRALENIDSAKAYITTPVQKAQWHLNTAVVLSRIENHQQQLRHYFDALEILEQAKDNSSLIYAIVITNISRVWGMINEKEKRDYYYQKAIGIVQNHGTDSLNWQDLLANLYNARASNYLDEQKWDDALNLLNKSLTITDAYPMLNRRRSEALLLSSDVYIQSGKIKKAYEFVDRYTALNKGKDVYTSLIVPNILKSTIAEKENNPAQTLEFVNIAMHQAKLTGIDKSAKLLRLWEIKVNAQVKLKQYEAAVASYQELVEILNINYNTEQSNANRTLDFIYRASIKDKEISNKQLLLDRKNNQIYQQKIIIGFITVILALALLLVYTFKKRQQSQKQLFELERKSDEIKHLRAITAIEEVQKRKLGAELHDGINGSMAAIKMNLNTIRKIYPELSNTPIFMETQEMLKETTDEIRQTAHALIPEMLLKNGLNQALIAHINRLNNSPNLTIDYNFFMEENALNPLANLTIYRIVQELLQNIVKHSKAKTASVQLFATKEKISLFVEDDGIGFDTEKVHIGIGIDNIKARVLSLEGELDILSTIGKQTVVRVSFDKQKLI